MSAHATLSASSAHRWIVCPGSVALCKDIPSRSSSFADEGTKAHELASLVLLNQSFETEYPDDMREEVQKYVKLVHDFTGGGTLMVEKRVDYSAYVGVPDSFGTSDAIIISPEGEELCCVDLKYGMGVKVDAEDNPQLMLYALGAIDELSVVYTNIKRVRLVIHQPRLDHISEWDCSLDHLLTFAETAKLAAQFAISILEGNPGVNSLHPGEDQCRWCAAKSECPALAQFVADTIGKDFEDITEEIAVIPNNLSAKMKATPLIEDWCKSIRARVEAELFAGNKVNGFKLVEGRKGARAWTNKDEVEAVLKAMRLKIEQMYDMTLISPTTAEKVLKDNPRRWAKLEDMITRKDGAPSVAPVKDKRPALIITPADQGFDMIETNQGE